MSRFHNVFCLTEKKQLEIVFLQGKQMYFVTYWPESSITFLVFCKIFWVSVMTENFLENLQEHFSDF